MLIHSSFIHPFNPPSPPIDQSTNINANHHQRQQVYKAMERAPFHVLAMDDQKFEDLMVTPGPKRDFPVVALFTAAGPKYGCTPCQ